MIIYSEIFEPTKPIITETLLYSEIEVIDPITIASFIQSFIDIFEVDDTEYWSNTPVFTDNLYHSETSTLVYTDNFEWDTIIDSSLLYQEDEPNPNYTWNPIAIYADNTNEWPHYKVVAWEFVYAELETILPLWESVYSDGFEYFAKWTLYPDGDGNLPYVFTHLFTDSYEFIPTLLNTLIFAEDTNIHPVWVALYAESMEWGEHFSDSFVYSESFAWLPDITASEIFRDTFTYDKPVTTFTLIQTDTLEWSDFDNWTIRLIENFEGEFVPYSVFPDDTGYLPRGIWRTTTLFAEDFEPLFTYRWSDSPWYSTGFNQIEPTFSTTHMYIEDWAWLPILQYNLNTIYTFDVVIWDETPSYTEDWEYIQKLNYFDPFEETFEWAPSTLNYNDAPDLLEDMELNLQWVPLFVDSYEVQ